MAKKLFKKKAVKKTVELVKNTKDLPQTEHAHPEYDPNLPLNKQRHLH